MDNSNAIYKVNVKGAVSPQDRIPNAFDSYNVLKARHLRRRDYFKYLDRSTGERQRQPP